MTPRRMAWRFAVLFWTVFGLVSGFQVWIGMITHGHSVVRLVSYYLLVWEAWLAATAAIAIASLAVITIWKKVPEPLVIAAAGAVGLLAYQFAAR